MPKPKKTVLEELQTRRKQSKKAREREADRAVFTGLVAEIRRSERDLKALEDAHKAHPEIFGDEQAGQLAQLQEYVAGEKVFLKTAFRLADRIKRDERDNLRGHSRRDVWAGTGIRYAAGIAALYALTNHLKDSNPFLIDLKKVYDRVLDTGESAKMVERTVFEYLRGKHKGIETLEGMLQNSGTALDQIQQLRVKMETVSAEAEQYAADLETYRKQFDTVAERISKTYEANETAALRTRRLKKQVEILKNDIGRINESFEDLVVNRSEGVEKAVDSWYKAFFGKSREELKLESKYQKQFDEAFKAVYKTMGEAKNGIDELVTDINELEQACLSLLEEEQVTEQQQKKLGKDVDQYGKEVGTLDETGKALEKSYKQEGELFGREAKFKEIKTKYAAIRKKFDALHGKNTQYIDEAAQTMQQISDGMNQAVNDVGEYTKAITKEREALQQQLREVLGDKHQDIYGPRDQPWFGMLDGFSTVVTIGALAAYAGTKALLKVFVPGSGIATAPVRAATRKFDGTLGHLLTWGKGAKVTPETMGKAREVQGKLYNDIEALTQKPSEYLPKAGGEK